MKVTRVETRERRRLLTNRVESVGAGKRNRCSKKETIFLNVSFCFFFVVLARQGKEMAVQRRKLSCLNWAYRT